MDWGVYLSDTIVYCTHKFVYIITHMVLCTGLFFQNLVGEYHHRCDGSNIIGHVNDLPYCFQHVKKCLIIGSG